MKRIMIDLVETDQRLPEKNINIMLRSDITGLSLDEAFEKILELVRPYSGRARLVSVYFFEEEK